MIFVNGTFFEKNKAARAVICLLLCIPLVVAFVAFKNVDHNAVNALTLKYINVEFDGQNMTFSDEDSFALYSEINKESTPADESFRDFSSEKPYTVKFVQSDDSELEYKFYMVEDVNDCIYKNSSGQYFIMAPEVASQLVTREEFSTVNADSFLPVATIERNGKTIPLSPSVYNWNYIALDGTPKETGGDRETQNEVVKFNKDNIGTLKFDREPDKITVTIPSENYADSFENLATLSFDSDYKLDMEILAEWYELEDSEYHGKLIYKLDALYDVKPTFKQVDSSIRRGDFTLIRMSDFNDGETLFIENEIGVPNEVKVYDLAGKKVKFAFVPVHATSPVGEQTLVYSTQDGDKYESKLTTRQFPNVPENKTVTVGDTSLHELFTEESVKEWKDLVREYTDKSENAQLWEGRFSYPTGSSEVVSGGFVYGSNLNVISMYSAEYLHEGIDLAPSDGREVCAANTGKVVFAGELDLMGKTVIVDHGSSVLSYYGHLETIETEVGAEVTKTTILGMAGNTGFACNASGNRVTMVHFAVSMGGIFVDPTSPCSAINLG